MTTTRTDQSPSLRPATSRDLPAVERLLTANSLPLTGVAENLESFVVAESGDQLVGVAGLEVCRNNALLRSTAVDPAWRSRGVGRQLVERVIAEAEARGIRALYLLTTTAEHYFPSFGFSRTTREAVPEDVRATAEFQGACPASAVVMSRELAVA
jgi:N-acetylglutamate synthase-like GNAT family acetyltransferase